MVSVGCRDVAGRWRMSGSASDTGPAFQRSSYHEEADCQDQCGDGSESALHPTHVAGGPLRPVLEELALGEPQQRYGSQAESEHDLHPEERRSGYQRDP